LLVELLTLVASWWPQRQFIVCADTGYAGKSVLRHLPTNVDLISQVHPQGVLKAPPPPPTGKRWTTRSLRTPAATAAAESGRSSTTV